MHPTLAVEWVPSFQAKHPLIPQRATDNQVVLPECQEVVLLMGYQRERGSQSPGWKMVFDREPHCPIVDKPGMALLVVRKAFLDFARGLREHSSPRVALSLYSPGHCQHWNCAAALILHPVFPCLVEEHVLLILPSWKPHILGNLRETEKAGIRNLHISWLGQPPSWVTTPAIDIPNTITNSPYRRKETRRSIGNSSCIPQARRSYTIW